MTKRKFTPPELAREWGIGTDKILAWIESGELRALNCATDADSKRPRWLIDEEDIEAFARQRANRPPLPRPRRSKAEPDTETFI